MRILHDPELTASALITPKVLGSRPITGGIRKMGPGGPKPQADEPIRSNIKILAGSIDSSSLTPKSLRQKIGETNKALPVRGGAGQAVIEASVDHQVFPHRVRCGP
jgi:hypothetical protein